MAKIEIQDVLDVGFRKEQFGTPADFETPETGYLARLIDYAAIWVSGMVGATAYNAAASGSIEELRLARAELCYVKAELWRRRAAFLDANAFSALEGNASAAAERTSYLKHAAEADHCAQYNVDVFNNGGDVSAADGGVSLGHVESGPFSNAEVAA